MINKTALVTGGSRGIGRAITLALVQKGWSVGFCYHAAERAAYAVLDEINQADGQGFAIQADLCFPLDRQRLLEAVLDHFGRIDLLVNNAGMAPRKRVDLLEVDETSFDEVMQANLKGPFFLTQAVAREMISLKQKGILQQAEIINIGSISAYASSYLRAEYCLSKAGVGMMTALFAERLASEGILVYEVRPGIIDTDMTCGVRDKYDQLIQGGLLPISRWGQPEDVARAVIALAEGCLPYSTGEVINVDGGFHLRRF
ncbi:MAG: 3-ketoacyl-ACP reductase [Anaerolineaceae bacterium]|jgi:NAD(P)-dependent dehydrogenase (short-subunit alcohol dehydrogenase family)